MKFSSKMIWVIITLFTTNLFAVDKKYHDEISPIISAFQDLNKSNIATFIAYPLHRKLPTPPIKNKTELVDRFDELFDKKLIELIANSDLDKDWSTVGWRGIMLSNGKLWLDLDGKITSINYQTSKEKAIQASLIKRQKLGLHSSISTYIKPILEWKTAKFHIRIDDLGDSNYRYVSWSIDKNTTDKPDLVLFEGERVADGSGGNHHYSFTNGKYIYRCYVNSLGTSESAPGTLEVFMGKKHLLSDDVIEVVGR